MFLTAFVIENEKRILQCKLNFLGSLEQQRETPIERVPITCARARSSTSMCKIAGLHKIQFYAPNGIFFHLLLSFCSLHCLLLFSLGSFGQKEQLLYFGSMAREFNFSRQHIKILSLGSLKRKNANRKLDIRIYVNLKGLSSRR